MITALELVMLTVPWFIYSAVKNKTIPIRYACRVIIPCFAIFIAALLSGWLCAFGVIDISWPAPSLFVGNEWWNLATGPVVIMLYIFVMSEICNLKQRQNL
ncbi:hypothetical protein HRJ45_12160 [Vibrio coralliilyticus]|uniref:hypothetical protein n=1 Tax=Vibrio coralliilyticus TaxID=190893 RepID=UPI001560DAB3|nr:hypothetical protein [Vibrio coralliilyticus]NRF25510.1 hypothetical protein [Vibrio coralliilyticus]NRF79863.1 hypothetical protein [Vibrio coralliilyticus]